MTRPCHRVMAVVALVLVIATSGSAAANRIPLPVIRHNVGVYPAPRLSWRGWRPRITSRIRPWYSLEARLWRGLGWGARGAGVALALGGVALMWAGVLLGGPDPRMYNPLNGGFGALALRPGSTLRGGLGLMAAGFLANLAFDRIGERMREFAVREDEERQARITATMPRFREAAESAAIADFTQEVTDVLREQGVVLPLGGQACSDLFNSYCGIEQLAVHRLRCGIAYAGDVLTMHLRPGAGEWNRGQGLCGEVNQELARRGAEFDSWGLADAAFRRLRDRGGGRYYHRLSVSSPDHRLADGFGRAAEWPMVGTFDRAISVTPVEGWRGMTARPMYLHRPGGEGLWWRPGVGWDRVDAP